MKASPLALSPFLTLTAFGQITADLALSEGGTPLGTLTLELDHVKSPMATANFIGLATGKFAWVDSSSGAVRHHTPYYDGIIFHRVVEGFVSQFGSQLGDGSDGPGYTFPDGGEVSNGLTHGGPYVVSMANAGPNTNGSQLFITAAAAGHLDGKHIVFGAVASESQSLADYLNGVPVAGNNTPVTDLTIDSVTINENGVFFDPCAQGLPVVSVPTLSPLPGPGSTTLAFTQPPRSVFRVTHSSDLVAWFLPAPRYLDGGDAAAASFPLPAGAQGNTRQFFAPALISYDSSALFPSSLANRTLTTLTAADPVNPIAFAFDATGLTGTWSYDGASGAITSSVFLPDGYGGRLILDISGFDPGYWSFQRLGFDSSTPTLLSGRQSGTAAQNAFFHSLGIGLSNISGTFDLTR